MKGLKKGLKYFVIAAGFMICLQSCKTNEPLLFADASKVAGRGYSGSAAPDRIYVPRYYVYKNGRYRFVKGHYRPILFRKNYWKRSLQGRTTRGDQNHGR